MAYKIGKIIDPHKCGWLSDSMLDYHIKYMKWENIENIKIRGHLFTEYLNMKDYTYVCDKCNEKHIPDIIKQILAQFNTEDTKAIYPLGTLPGIEVNREPQPVKAKKKIEETTNIKQQPNEKNTKAEAKKLF